MNWGCAERARLIARFAQPLFLKYKSNPKGELRILNYEF